MIEKVIGYLKGFILMSAIVFIPAACSQGAADEPEPVVPETPNEGNEVLDSDSVMVSFAPTSLEWEVSPMSRASNDDLYAVIVYQSNNPIENEADLHTKATQSALALFDDLNLISLKLAKNQYYHFAMTYIPNGKNIIEKQDKGWGAPFTLRYAPDDIPELNSVVYKKVINTQGFIEAPSQVKGMTTSSPSANFFNEVLRYMGISRNFKPETNNQKVTIELYRWQYGIRITATDFHEGTVSIVSRVLNAESKGLTMQSNSSGTSKMEYCLEYLTTSYVAPMFSYKNPSEFADNYGGFGDDIEIIYTTSKGEEIQLWSSRGSGFPFKRLKMHTLEFSLSDAIANGGIAPDLMEAATDPMEEVNWEF